MGNSEHIAKLFEGVEAWNQWRASNPTANLGGAQFAGKNLSGARLQHVNLYRANLRGADLRDVTFQGSDLSGTNLREANLQCADLSDVTGGLQTEQLAGADLTGAKLPDELKKLYEGLQNVNNISESARKLFLAVLAACLYSWLTIATTTDVNLITNRASSPLPIIQTSIPIVGFYWVAPLLLLCVYFYLHFYLQKLWEELGSLPAILPDGRPLYAKIDPWLLNDLVRSHLPKLNVNRPFLSYFQLWISVLLAWWVVPITMFLFWGRFLRRLDRIGTTFHVALLVISLTAALRLYQLAVATLRGDEREPFRWKGTLTSRRGYQTAAFAVAIGVLFGVVSWGARWGVPSNAPILGVSLLRQRSDLWPRARPTGSLTWVPRVMALVGYSTFADLTNAEVSQKQPGWSKNDKDLDSVTGARLEGANLRYASALGAFLVGAHLEGANVSGAKLGRADLRDARLQRARAKHAQLDEAHLQGANLNEADLQYASLIDADLSGARLFGADLSGAHLMYASLSGADLRGAGMDGADVTYSDFRGAKNLRVEALKAADNWEKAYYDGDILKALGLPPDHNVKLAEQQHKEDDVSKRFAPAFFHGTNLTSPT